MLTLIMPVILDIVDHREFPSSLPTTNTKRMMTERDAVFKTTYVRKTSRRCALPLAIVIVNNCIQYTHKTSSVLAPYAYKFAFE